MKLRMQGNSVRLRLTRSEVTQFAAEGRVEETVAFPSSVFHYALSRSAGPDLSADCSADALTVYLPESSAAVWTSTEQVGVEARVNGLHILIEKDFQCAHGAVDPDAFDPQPASDPQAD